MATRVQAPDKKAKRPQVPKAYLRLVRRLLLRPIDSEQQLAEATALADELFDRKSLLPEEAQYLDVLCDLIAAYEDKICPIRDVGAAEMLGYLIEQRGVTQRTVAKETGIANSTVTALLKGDREMTRKHVEAFARYFHVDPGVFLPGN